MFPGRSCLPVIVVFITFIAFSNGYYDIDAYCTKLTRDVVSISRKIETSRGPKFVNQLVTKYRLVWYCCPGYNKIEIGSNFTCIAESPVNCTNGSCIARGITICEEGFELKNNTCQTAGDVGNETQDQNENNNNKTRHQLKYDNCLNGCDHLTCSAKNICVCDDGWIMEAVNSSEVNCRPVCTYRCINSTCTAPDTCECLSGYKVHNDTVCIPHTETQITSKTLGPNTREFNVSDSMTVAETNNWPDLLNVQWDKDHFLVKHNNVKKVFMHIWFEIDNEKSNQTSIN